MLKGSRKIRGTIWDLNETSATEAKEIEAALSQDGATQNQPHVDAASNMLVLTPATVTYIQMGGIPREQSI